MQVEREVRLHGGLCHENIIQLYAAFKDGVYTVSLLFARHCNSHSPCFIRKAFDPPID